MPRRSPFEITLSTSERSVLEAVQRRYTAPYRDVVRAWIILMAARGLQNKEIAARLSMPVQVVSKWRKRFFRERLPGLEERERSGRHPVFPPRTGGSGQSHRL